jgi:hypothetical protein
MASQNGRFAPQTAALCEVIHRRDAASGLDPKSKLPARRGIQMRTISFVIAATALILTTGVGGWVGGWVASTAAHDRALHVENFRGGTPLGGGISVMPAAY